MTYIVNTILNMRASSNKYLVFVLSSLLVLLIGYLDWLTRHYIIFAIFYLIPISLSVMFLGRRAGIFLSFLASAIWFFMDVSFDTDYTHIFYPVANNLMRFGYFVIHTFMLSSIIELLVMAEDLSLKDPLTGIGNSRAFRLYLGLEVNKARRTQKPLTMVFFDLDNFKEVNDIHGHSTGDELLRTVADTIRKELRDTDIFARIGGDEFSIILPETGKEETSSIADRFRKEVIDIMQSKKWPVTLSIGTVTYRKFDISADEMLHRVDEVMYKVKKSGKNNILQEEYL